MQATRDKGARKAHLRRFLLIFLVSCLVLGIISGGVISALQRNEKNQKLYLLESKANDIKDRLDRLTARVHAMAFALMAEKGNPESFDVLAPLVLQGWDENAGDIVRNVALAPEGVVQYVYPLEGNEPLIGYDLWEAAAPNPLTVETLQQGRVHITPPIPLVQGGWGLNISLPVTMPGEEASWGIVAIVVDPDKLIASFGLQELTDHQAEYALAYQDMDGSFVTLVESAPVEQPLSLSFTTENIQWEMCITGTSPLGIYAAAGLIAGIIAVSLLIAYTLNEQFHKKELHQLFHRLANTDSVTGCASRHYVYEALVDKSTGKWRDEKVQYGLAILDVDKFKQVNDTYGHEVGDEILQQIARMAMEKMNQKGDCVIRFGGDEFVLLFAGRTQDEMRAGMEQLLQDVRKITLEERPDIRATISIGGVHPQQMKEQPPTYKNMLRLADARLYEAKESGRDCIRM